MCASGFLTSVKWQQCKMCVTFQSDPLYFLKQLIREMCNRVIKPMAAAARLASMRFLLEAGFPWGLVFCRTF